MNAWVWGFTKKRDESLGESGCTDSVGVHDLCLTLAGRQALG